MPPTRRYTSVPKEGEKKKRSTSEERTFLGVVYPSMKAMEDAKSQLRFAFAKNRAMTDAEREAGRVLHEQFLANKLAGREKAKAKGTGALKETFAFIRDFNKRMKEWKKNREQRPDEDFYDYRLRIGAYTHNNPTFVTRFTKKEDCQEPVIIPWEIDPVSKTVYANVFFKHYDQMDTHYFYVMNPDGENFRIFIHHQMRGNPLQNFPTPYMTGDEHSQEAWKAWAKKYNTPSF